METAQQLSTIQVKDKQFEVYIHSDEVQQCVQNIASKIDSDYAHKNPLVLGILNGSFMFVSDLVKKTSIDPQISFIKLASYEGTTTTGHVQQLVGLKENIKDRHVIVVEDIVDTGNTLEKILSLLSKEGPASIETVALLYKPEAYEKEFPIKYIGKEIPNKFVVGYGLDYDGYGRSLEHIYQIV